jgi:hypothetical protein
LSTQFNPKTINKMLLNPIKFKFNNNNNKKINKINYTQKFNKIIDQLNLIIYKLKNKAKLNKDKRQINKHKKI